MKGRWWIGLGIVLVAAAATWAEVHRNNLVPPTKWTTANPIVGPSRTHPISLMSPVGDRTKVLPLPPGHLPNTDWYLPITPQSQLTYVLHDGQSRWLVNGHAIALQNAPTDPVGQLVFAPDGRELAWSQPHGVSLIRSNGTTQTMPHAIIGYFTAHNFFDYVTKTGTSLEIHSRFPTRTLSASDSLGYHPFVFDGHSLVFDQAGQISLLSLSTGAVNPILRVRPSRWPQLVDSVSYDSHIALLFRRPSALPAYLLALKTGHTILWYRWKTGLKPQMGISAGHLVINNLDPSGQLVALGTHNLHPLPQSTGLFSQSPKGVVFETNRGFILLSQIG